MIIIKLKGGLGNQLFQYAYGRLLSVKNGVEVKYEFSGRAGDTAREYKLGYFNTKVVFPIQDESEKTRRPFGAFSDGFDWFTKKILRQYNIGYSETSLQKKSGYCEGFWQSYKYLEPIQTELLKEITLKNPLDAKYANTIKQMSETNSVSVHIRRGDYVSDAKTKSEHYTFGLEYYEAAFQLIQTKIQNPELFVFSDDINWVKENLKTDLPMIFVSEPTLDYENFMIATYCKNNIIANSTFSFWIAWLNQNQNKIVIAPKKWNNRYQEKYKDLLPKDWITL